MKPKLLNQEVFKPTGPPQDFNRPSEIIQWISKQVAKEMAEAFKRMREEK